MALSSSTFAFIVALGLVGQHFEKLLLEFDVAIKLRDGVRQARAFVEPIFQVNLFQTRSD